MKRTLTLIISASLLGLVAVPTVAFGDGHVSKSPLFWTFPAESPAGMTKLVRTKNGLTGQVKTTGLMAGHAVTLWIMFYNSPENCGNYEGGEQGVCTPLDVEDPATGFDFHYASGHIVNDKKTTLSGHVRVGELSTSGWAEIGVPLATPLTNPMGAQVILAVHSHGPAQRGRNLAAQMSSYTGGCVGPFLGDAAGFAQDAGDIPANEGECSTIQVAFHNP